MADDALDRLRELVLQALPIHDSTAVPRELVGAKAIVVECLLEIADRLDELEKRLPA